MPDETEIDLEVDLDGEGPMPPMRLHFDMSDAFWKGYVAGALVMSLIYMGIVYVV